MAQLAGSESASLTSSDGVTMQPKAPQAAPEPQYNIYQLCMRGYIDQIADLVDSKGADVTVRDEENITCLHWASINNRSELCTYLISKGAEVDALGGELMATPLQWAVRHGHLQTTKVLLQHGANPTIKDVQGFNAFHLAVQFGADGERPAACAAYMASKTDIDVDVKDDEGRTALMWAAMKDFSPDTTRLLIGLGASLNAQDNNGMTALHYAVVNSNMSACQALVEKGARYDLINSQEKGAQTARDLVYEQQRTAYMMRRWIPPPSKPDPILTVLHAEPVRKNLMLCLPLVGLCGIGLALELLFQDPMKGVAVFFSVIAIWTQGYSILAENAPPTFVWPGAMAVYLGTKIMMFLCFFYLLWPATQGPGALVGYEWDFLAVLFSVGLWYNFYKAHTVDPGFVPSGTMQNSKKAICKLCDDGEFDKVNFCYSCCIRKPFRSKHDQFTGRCVAKFDHYCPFTGNAIGANNHRYFMLFLICMPCLIWVYIYLAIHFMVEECGVHKSLIKTGVHFVPCQPFLCWTIANGAMHSTWVLCLFAMQMRQIAGDLTTNEAMNQYRYAYLRNGSPWDRGCIRNIINFYAGDTTDWTKVFSLPRANDWV